MKACLQTQPEFCSKGKLQNYFITSLVLELTQKRIMTYKETIYKFHYKEGDLLTKRLTSSNFRFCKPSFLLQTCVPISFFADVPYIRQFAHVL